MCGVVHTIAYIKEDIINVNNHMSSQKLVLRQQVYVKNNLKAGQAFRFTDS